MTVRLPLEIQLRPTLVPPLHSLTLDDEARIEHPDIGGNYLDTDPFSVDVVTHGEAGRLTAEKEEQGKDKASHKGKSGIRILDPQVNNLPLLPLS